MIPEICSRVEFDNAFTRYTLDSDAARASNFLGEHLAIYFWRTALESAIAELNKEAMEFRPSFDSLRDRLMGLHDAGRP